MKLTVALAIIVIVTAPQAHADEYQHQYWEQWDHAVAPVIGDAVASPRYLTPQPGTYPVGTPGSWQVYATPPGAWVPPGPQNFCGTTTSQAEAPAGCPTGWDLWYR